MLNATTSSVKAYYNGQIEFWGKVWEDTKKALADAKESLFKGLQSAIDGVGNFFKSLIDEIIKKFEQVKNAVLNPISSITSTVSSFIPAPVTNFVSNATNAVSNAVSAITGGGNITKKATAKYMGYIPAISASDGLLGAIATSPGTKSPRLKAFAAQLFILSGPVFFLFLYLFIGNRLGLGNGDIPAR